MYNADQQVAIIMRPIKLPLRTCEEGTYPCEDGGCIPDSWVCDGRTDCTDASDESYSACQTFPCDNDTDFRFIDNT